MPFMLRWIKDVDAHSIIIHFYIALFFAFEQTHRTRVACDSEWVSFYSFVFNIHQSGVLTACAIW